MAKDHNSHGTSFSTKSTETFADNLERFVEEAGKVASAYWGPRVYGNATSDFSDTFGEIVKTFARVGESLLAEPERIAAPQNKLFADLINLWSNPLKRMIGVPAAPAVEPKPRDRRFNDPEWSENQFFDFIKQAYLITTRFAEELVERTDDLDPHTRHKAAFYVQQIANALAPSNFILTNPELLRETLASNGENLIRGMHMLAEDIEAGGGELKIRQTDTGDFQVGKNIATTPGKVIHQNDLCQLIQYRATTTTVFKRPLLIVPPWINKYYVLDLNTKKSFIRWAVAQGHTVFVLSWVNPDETLAHKSFEHYMREGIFESLDVIEKITGAGGINAVGYCVGGTLLSIALAYGAATGDQRIKSATFLATQVDFTHAGDLKVFVDEDQIASLEDKMHARGYLEGLKMAQAFNLLRANDLVWPYFINNYYKGRSPRPFDLLFWNSDSTRMPAANHAFYLRYCYLENRLATGTMEIAGIRLDLKNSKIPTYNLATREDHIAPARSAFYGASLFGGKAKFVLSGSGHIAGVVNPPNAKKYQYWTGPAPKGDGYDKWLEKTKEHPGSWWPHWQDWMEALNGSRIKARRIGGGKFKPIEDAPGSYVKVRA